MIRVLVVDDSAVMRSFLAGVIGSQPDMQVAAVVSDAVLAIDRIRQQAPDVITLDVEMPRMNGLDFLRSLMTVRPLPVVMISSLTREGADATMRALELGAVDFIPKPGSAAEFESVVPDILDKIREAAQARVVRRHRTLAQAEGLRGAAGTKLPPGAAVATGRIVGIGASTGGVEALREILPQLTSDIAPVLIAQHMLQGFTPAFARRLDSLCEIGVKEAQDGEIPLAGCAYVAPGGRHMLLARHAGKYVLRLTDDAPVNRHRPSVDTLFRSMLINAGADTVAALLTGMGDDGAHALLELKQAGASTIAQDEATSVVFGMPRQAIELGAAQEVLPLSHIGPRLRELARAPQRSPITGSS